MPRGIRIGGLCLYRREACRAACRNAARHLRDAAMPHASRQHRALGLKHFVTFTSRDSVAKRLADPEFTVLLNKWLDYLGKDRFPTILVDGVACRLGEHDFDAKMVHWQDLLGRSEEGIEKFVTIVANGGITARYRCMDTLIRYYATGARWTREMSRSRIDLVPCDQTETVPWEVIRRVVANSTTRRVYSQSRPKRYDE